MLGFPREFMSTCLFDDIFARRPTKQGFDLDVKEEGDNIVIRADVPGIHKEDLDVVLENGVLTITAERCCEIDQDSDFHVRERSYGKFSRSIQIPRDVDPSAIKATIQDGVLQLIVRQCESRKSKKIEIG